MRQRSLVEQSSEPATSLHPVLRAALNSLDVDLEEELARYRRLQGHTRELHRPERRPVVPEARQHPTAAVFAAGSTVLPESAAAPVPIPSDYQPVPPSSNLTAPVVPLPVAPEGLPADDGDMPNDYLASSEELLRGLSDEEVALGGEREPRLFDTLLTPLGIGSMLLLLLSSISFGYLIFNPQSMKLLGLEQWFNPSDSSNSGSIAQSSDLTRPTVAPSPNLAAEEFPELNLDTLSALPPGGPSPASESASPVPTVRTTPITTPAAAASPAASPTARSESSASRTAAPAAPRAQSLPRVAPAAPARSPASAPSVAASRPAASAPRPAAPAPSVVAPRPAASAPAVAAAPAATLYYVVVPYSGDRSLEQVRQVVGDAYVRNYPSGARVQAGAFSEASRARELVQELSQQGISAQLIQPSN